MISYNIAKCIGHKYAQNKKQNNSTDKFDKNRRIGAGINFSTLIFVLMVWSAGGALSVYAAANDTIQSQVNTASSSSMNKLAPDLREAARTPSDRIVTVSVLISKGTSLNSLMTHSAISKPIGDIQWITGKVTTTNLTKIASVGGVISIISTETYKPGEIPDDFKTRQPRLDRDEIRTLIEKGGKTLLQQKLKENQSVTAKFEKNPMSSTGDISPATIKVKDIHGAANAWAKGYTGKGVVVAVVDTGVDFSHPDLQNTQIRISGGPYDGWPFSYNTLSGAYYAMDANLTVGPDNYWNPSSWYAHTLPVTGATCNDITCTGNLKIDFGFDAGFPSLSVTKTFTWLNTSKSGTYYYTVHPDYNLLIAADKLNLGYAHTDFAPPAVILSDENTSGVYDTVYVDVDFNQDLTTEKPMKKGDELAGADLYNSTGSPGTDGIWDLSAGMLTWIADGTNPPPGIDALYINVTVPSAGSLLSFVGDEDSHGTNCAGDIAAQGIITDPDWRGPINPLFAGAVNLGGVGGNVLSGMAPDAKIAAFQNGFNLPYDSWVLAVLGADGIPNSGDEAQIVSNSWGASETINDGWDMQSRFANNLNLNFAPNSTFLVATGNGGHGYGTVSGPDGGSIIDVGASTSFGTLSYFELVYPSQFTYGDVIPWSNRGPTTLGDVSPDIVAIGAWGTGANPLNLYYGNGQAAYDVFGGTSMATPIAAGNLALVYQAYKSKYGVWPNWQQAKAMFLNGASDLGYDVFTQGSGNVNSDRSTDIAAGTNAAYWVEPAQWMAGTYQGMDYPDFPAIIYSGASSNNTFIIHNPTEGALTINLSDTTLAKVHEENFTINFDSFDSYPFTLPTYVQNITSLINTYDPDLVRAQVVFPFCVFDTEGDYSPNNLWHVMFYDWNDSNSDGNLWTDTNGNGRVESGEIDIDPSGVYEFNRFTYGYPAGTYLEASLGRDSISHKHDGVFFGLQRALGSDAVTMQVRLTFYKKTDWDWLNTSTDSLVVPAGSDATFNAVMNVPDGTKPGAYEGAIEASQGLHKHVIPVVTHVAANSESFEFGASSLSDTISNQPYDNNYLFGGFSWSWRYESGDWKLFYYEVPNGTAGDGNVMIVDTQWNNTATDVDTWIFGASSDNYSNSDPDYFGPSTVQQIGGSQNTYLGSGKFKFNTSTGGPREIVGGEIRDGLGFITLHNVLNAGTQIGEPIMGIAYQANINPWLVNISTSNYSGSWIETFTTKRTIEEGINAFAFGLSEPIILLGETVNQDDPDDHCKASWTQSINISHGGLLEVTTISSVTGLDVDLYLYKDDGNGIWDCGTDALISSSTTSTADEHIIVSLPPDGMYWVTVHGFNVLGGSQPLNITINAIQGTDMTVSDLPLGPVSENSPVTFKINYLKYSVPNRTMNGLLFMGPAFAPMVLQVPVTFTIAGSLDGNYPIDSNVFTTIERTVIPVPVPSTSPKLKPLPNNVSNFSKYGYGVWQFGDGLGVEKRLDLMPPAYNNTSVTNTARLLKFFAMTDIHITDEETPAQAIFYGNFGISGGYSPVMLYTTQVLDAAVQTVNAIHKQNPIDFGISLGDAINNDQYNELRLYIDVLDGKNITPDSGVRDDPVPGPYNDYQDEYKAAGLNKTIPWYQTLGNHDHFWIGTHPVNDYIRPFYTGEEILNLGNIFTDPLGFDSRGFYMGSINGSTPYGDVIGVGPVKDFAVPPKVLAADPNRRSISRVEWMSEFFNTSSSPNGHGFNQSNVTTGFASYAFEPKSDIPIKVIVLDDTQRGDDPDVGGYGHGSLDKERYDWLVSELDKGQAESKLMIIAAHIPIGVEPAGSNIGWWNNSYISENDLIAKLHEYPNLLMWVAGHRHRNTVTAFISPDVNHPEFGYWQVETSSLREFPQQFRTFEIVRNSDNTVSIFTTNVDPAVKNGSLAAISRSVAVAAQQIFNNPLSPMPNGSYNAELVKQLSPQMQAKIQNYGTIINISAFITNATLVITAPGGNVTVTIPKGTNASVGGFALTSIWVYSISQVNSTFLANLDNDKLIGENISLGPEGAIFSPDIQIRFNYTDAMLTAAGISALDLRVKFYDLSTNTWVLQTPYTLNETDKYITANVSHFSTFALIGTVTTTATTTSVGGSSGGSTGGSGVVTSEPYDNIAKSERNDRSLIANKSVTYTFKVPELGIYEIAVTGKENENDITLRVEILKGTSKLAKVKAPGIVYKNVNVWTGTEKMKEALIRFRVENSWLESNSLAGSDVKMARWEGSQWTQIETVEKTKDDTNTYYEAKTETFHMFTITGSKDGVVVPTTTSASAVNETSANPSAIAIGTGTTSQTSTASPAPVPTKAVPGFEFVLVIAILSVAYLSGRMRR